MKSQEHELGGVLQVVIRFSFEIYSIMSKYLVEDVGVSCIQQRQIQHLSCCVEGKV